MTAQSEPSHDPGANTFTTRRLTLRPLEFGDAFSLFALDRSAAAHEFLLDDCLNSLPNAAAFVHHMHGVYERWPGLGMWAAIDGESRFVGQFSCLPLDPQDPTCRFFHIGSRLLPKYWGRWYAVEGMRGMCERFFRLYPQQDALHGMCHPQNRAPQLVLKRGGFTPAGSIDHFGQAANVYRLTREQWNARH